MKLLKNSNRVRSALADQVNQLRRANVGVNFHYQATPAGPPSETDPPTVTTLAITANTLSNDTARAVRANDIVRVLNEHFKDMQAHKSVQTAAINVATAVDLATAITAINAARTAYNTGGHINTANVHANNDTTNTITAVAATDAASFDTLAAEMTTDVNAHIATALAGQCVELQDS